MAKTLIDTPFPTTAEVGKIFGASKDRVARLEQMVSLNLNGRFVASGRRRGKGAAGTRTAKTSFKRK